MSREREKERRLHVARTNVLPLFFAQSANLQAEHKYANLSHTVVPLHIGIEHAQIHKHGRKRPPYKPPEVRRGAAATTASLEVNCTLRGLSQSLVIRCAVCWHRCM